MRYTVRKSVVQVVGKLWMPMSTGATEYTLSGYDVENARDEDGKITRDSVDHWLALHSGDFSSIEDFRASIEDGDETTEIPWAKEESEYTFGDCMYPAED